MTSFEVSISKAKVNQTMPTSKIRAMFPISEKIRRRAFVLNSQEQQRCQKFVSQMDLEGKLQELRFARIQRHLETDRQSYEVYKRALYNVGKQNSEDTLLNKSQVVQAKLTRRRKIPVLPSIKSEKEKLDKEEQAKSDSEFGEENNNEGDKKCKKSESLELDTKDTDSKTNGGENYIALASEITDAINVAEQQGLLNKSEVLPDIDARVIDEVQNANNSSETKKTNEQIKKKRKIQKAKQKLTGDYYHLRRTPKVNRLPQYGLYNGKVYRHLTKERKEALVEIDPEERRKRRALALLADSKAESSVLIDRTMPTSALFRHKEAPLKYRLKQSGVLKLKPVKAKMKAVQAFMKVRQEANEKNESPKDEVDKFGRGNALANRKAANSVFATKIWDY